MVEKSLVSRQEAKTRELESKLEFEKTQVKRLEVNSNILDPSPSWAGLQDRSGSQWTLWKAVRVSVSVPLPLCLQSLVARLKENLEKLTEERDQRSGAENREKEQNKRLQRQIRDAKEEMGELAKKEAEASRKKHELVSSHSGLAPPRRSG